MVVGEAAGLESPEILVGTALPDLNDMCRDYSGVVLPSSVQNVDSEELTEGIDMHQRTDSAYMALPEKTALLINARTNFEKTGNPISRAAMSGCADAGTKILLDGILWHESKTRDLYNRVRESVITGKINYRPTAEAALLGHFVENYFLQSNMDHYQDPEMVAIMLHRRFLARKKQVMAFDENEIPQVAEVLDKQYVMLGRLGGLIVSKLIKATNIK